MLKSFNWETSLFRWGINRYASKRDGSWLCSNRYETRIRKI